MRLLQFLHSYIQKGKSMDKVLRYAGAIFGLLSPELKADIKAGLDKWEAKAKETKNPFDDIAVMILKGLIS